MSPLSGQPRQRRLRSDAVQNAEAILNAASTVLAERPEAGLAEVAQAAGVSRKTLYMHFASREALINALIERATGQVVAALEAADLDTGPADQALVRLMEIGWRSLDADPFLLHLASSPVSPEQDRERHEPIMERLRAVVARGQLEGHVDPELTIEWVLAAVLALGHAAGEEVRAGRMDSDQAIENLRIGIPRLVRPDGPNAR